MLKTKKGGINSIPAQEIVLLTCSFLWGKRFCQKYLLYWHFFTNKYWLLHAAICEESSLFLK